MAIHRTAALLSTLCLWSVALTDAASTRGTFEECRPPHCDDPLPSHDVDAGDPPVVVVEETGGGGGGGGGGNEVDRNDFFCLPDGDGFIGTIEGSSYVVPYAFGLETERNAEIVDILRDVKISVENFLIEQILPGACDEGRQLQRGLADGTVLGFRFEKEMDLLSVACTPLVKPDADCGIYEGVIQVYGSGGNILSKVQTHLNKPTTTETNDAILRIFSTQTSDPNLDQELIEEESSPAPVPLAPAPTTPSKATDEGGGLSAGGIVGIVIAILFVAVGIVGFLFFQQRRRNQIGDCDESVNSQVYYDKDGDLGSVPTQGSRVTLGVEDGRPIYEYDLK